MCPSRPISGPFKIWTFDSEGPYKAFYGEHFQGA